MKTLLFLLAFSCVLPLAHAEEAVTYDTIKPLLKKHCLRCHGRFFPQAKLRLISPKHILKGGQSGAVVVPGKPDQSLLIQGVELPAKEKKHMPPLPNKSLSAEEITLLRNWVTQGAK